MKVKIGFLFIALLAAPVAFPFCGFYVAKAPAGLFNHKSEVILVRDGNHSVVTMSNDFKGEVKDFAIVIPVPVVLKKNQIRIVSRGLFDRLDAYSAPRMVEYFDQNPCERIYAVEDAETKNMAAHVVRESSTGRNKKKEYKVTIVEQYTVGEYDMMILSAEESDGLMRWLTDHGYRIPDQAEEVLEPYIANNMKFFVAKVNLDAYSKSGFSYLNPIQMDFYSERFELPIRLGMANAEHAQDLIIYSFSRKGRVETINYRTVEMPTDRNVPLFVEHWFGDFYTDLFNRAYYREGMDAVFLEYAWNVSPQNRLKCDPCVSPPPLLDDLAEAGVDWAAGGNGDTRTYFTRMHVRYTRNKFPQDLQFQVTPDTRNFQVRYIITHPAEGDLSCAEGHNYVKHLENRRRREVAELKSLAGWTNPNYADYITEYSRNASDRYAPRREDFFPATRSANSPGPPKREKWYFVLSALAGLMLLWLIRRAATNKLV